MKTNFVQKIIKMVDNEKKALQLIQEAEKKSKSGGGLFGMFGGYVRQLFACIFFFFFFTIIILFKKNWVEVIKNKIVKKMIIG